MISQAAVHSIAETTFRISEHVALEQVEAAFSAQPRAVIAKRRRTPLLDRKPLAEENELTLDVLRTAAAIPRRANPLSRCAATPVEVIDPTITVGTAMFELRERITLLAALLRDSKIELYAPDCLWTSVQVAAGDIVQEAKGLLAVVEIGALEEHTHQVRSSM